MSLGDARSWRDGRKSGQVDAVRPGSAEAVDEMLGFSRAAGGDGEADKKHFAFFGEESAWGKALMVGEEGASGG